MSVSTDKSFLRVLTKVIVYSPWLWLALFGLFVVGVSLQVGHLPTYGQPDPKDAGAISLLYVPTIFLLLWVLATVPTALVMVIFAKAAKLTQPFQRRDIIIYLAGMALFALLVFGNVAGLMTWLGD